MKKNAVDVAVVGAGLAGITCAQQLVQSGLQVVVVEKSRGLGGRLATRRLPETCADHGVRYLAAQGDLTAALIEKLVPQGILQPWSKAILRHSTSEQITEQKSELQPELYYAAPAGLTAVAKYLAADLEIWRSQRVQAINSTSAEWQLELEATDAEARSLAARSIVLAIPAPQALMLLEPLAQQGFSEVLIQQVRSVEFDPCLTVIATYVAEQQRELADLPWQAVQFVDSPELAWLSCESTKRSSPALTAVIAQSTAAFAAQQFEAPDLQTVGRQLLSRVTNLIPWLDQPIDLQVHRWRYAFVKRGLTDRCLATREPLPLVCSGDWCGGNQIEDALKSGLAAANQIQAWLGDQSAIDPVVQLAQLLQQLPN